MVNTEVREGQMVGSRVYERLLVPGAPGEVTIPSLTYVYFDPDAGQYQTLQAEPILVSIAPGAPGAPPASQPAASQPAASQSAAGQQPASDRKEAVEQLATDIRHLKPVPARLGVSGGPLTASGLYWAAWAFPVLGAVGFFVWQGRQRYLENNLGLARSSQARRKARKALARARKQGQDVYSAAGQILTAYLSDKLDRPVAGLTHQALAELLAGYGLRPDLVDRIETLLVTSELGRYAPGADDPGHAHSLLKEADALIGALEKAL
jgi:hypothetical protein